MEWLLYRARVIHVCMWLYILSHVVIYIYRARGSHDVYVVIHTVSHGYTYRARGSHDVCTCTCTCTSCDIYLETGVPDTMYNSILRVLLLKIVSYTYIGTPNSFVVSPSCMVGSITIKTFCFVLVRVFSFLSPGGQILHDSRNPPTRVLVGEL